MKLSFSKYHGTGNDFVLIDATVFSDTFVLSTKQIKLICDRRFGIGADGLMILRSSDEADFFMDYYNSDGRRSTMCGNGGRCISQFAFDLAKIKSTAKFLAIDGIHHTEIQNNGMVSLEMNDVTNIALVGNDFVLDTGSPHYLRFVDDIKAWDINSFGKEIRYSDQFSKEGINVNLVEILNDHQIEMQTYERGVEAETFSCGTGMVAAAICLVHNASAQAQDHKVWIQTKGGKTMVTFKENPKGVYMDIRLVGPAVHVYDGTIII